MWRSFLLVFLGGMWCSGGNCVASAALHGCVCVLCRRWQPLQAGLDHPVAHNGAGEGEQPRVPAGARAVGQDAPLAEPQGPTQVWAASLPRGLAPWTHVHPRGPANCGGSPRAVPTRGVRPPLPAALPAPATRRSHPSAYPQHRDHDDAAGHAAGTTEE